MEAILSQARNPLEWLLLFAAVVSGAVSEWRDAVVPAILLLGSVLGAMQERRASRAVETLRARISARARVRRDGAEAQVRAAEVVPGDVVLLAAGSLVPADGVRLDARPLRLAGRAHWRDAPAEKSAGIVDAGATLAVHEGDGRDGPRVASGPRVAAQVVATGVGAVSVEHDHLGAPVALDAEDAHQRAPLDLPPTQRLPRLEADDEHGFLRVLDGGAEVVPHAAPIAHPARDDDDRGVGAERQRAAGLVVLDVVEAVEVEGRVAGEEHRPRLRVEALGGGS